MHKDDTFSIFSTYYKLEPLADRFETDRARAVDVIIPIIHTNEMWRANLLSIYREIPVNRLILGDGGCVDDSLDVAREFPRVEVLDHRSFTSLGFSLRHLIEATSTEWFVYLHSDVFLPPGWFDAMSAHRGEYDWFECNQRITVMADYLLDTTKVNRSYSGSQMGRKAAFAKVTPQIDDDYLYRNEDIILAKLLERTGGRYGKVGETHHFHQIMHKPSRWHRAIKRVAIDLDLARDEEIRSNRTYARGIIKYLESVRSTGGPGVGAHGGRSADRTRRYKQPGFSGLGEGDKSAMGIRVGARPRRTRRIRSGAYGGVGPHSHRQSYSPDRRPVWCLRVCSPWRARLAVCTAGLALARHAAENIGCPIAASDDEAGNRFVRLSVFPRTSTPDRNRSARRYRPTARAA